MAKQNDNCRHRGRAPSKNASLGRLLPALRDAVAGWRSDQNDDRPGRDVAADPGTGGTEPGTDDAVESTQCVRPRELAGFTLIEVMISSVIMAFVLVSILAVISRTSRYLMDLRIHARSSQVLQQRIEELRSMSWDQITNLPTTFTSSGDTNGTFGKSLNISNYESLGTTTIVVQATAVVTWTNRQSIVVTNTLTTLISNGGLNKTSL